MSSSFLFTCPTFHQAFPGEDGTGAIPDRDQRPAGPAVRDARRARLGQEVGQRRRERWHYGGKASSTHFFADHQGRCGKVSKVVLKLYK